MLTPPVLPRQKFFNLVNSVAEDRTEEYAAWLRLVFFSGLSRTQCRRVLSSVTLPQEIFSASHNQLRKNLEPAQISALKRLDERAQEAIDKALAWTKQEQHELITLADPHYPQALLELSDPPLVLFALGHIAALNRSSIAIVGSRHATAQGVRDTEDLARALAQAGQIVVSGLAEGIDAAAHRGALSSKLSVSTIAVIGTGIDLVYPARHRALAHEIAQNGLILSEFMLGSRAVAYHFPQRNRIISGLARGVVVMEAAVKSGSLITARLAAEQGRDVFAVPGSIHSPLARGCHALIRQGAKLVETAQDVLEELQLVSLSPPSSMNPMNHKTEETQSPTAELRLESDLQAVLETIPTPLSKIGFAPFNFEDALMQTNLDVAQLNAQLLDWELGGAIQRLNGGMYQRIR